MEVTAAMLKYLVGLLTFDTIWREVLSGLRSYNNNRYVVCTGRFVCPSLSIRSPVAVTTLLRSADASLLS